MLLGMKNYSKQERWIPWKLLEIVTFPDKFLKQPTKPVENIDGELQNLIDKMAHTMYAAPGVGLAAISGRARQEPDRFRREPRGG